MSRCEQELCLHWAGGPGCLCDVFDVAPIGADGQRLRTGDVQCDGNCHEEYDDGSCESCGSGEWARMCEDCRFSAGQDA